MDEPAPDIVPSPEELPRLAAALRGLAAVAQAVPASVDAAVLSGARAALGRRPRRWVLAPLAAAAAVVVGAIVLRGTGTGTGTGTGPQGDVDGDGRVDILDAFALARTLNSQPSTLNVRRPDLTGDGLVDAADVRAIALIAVALPPGRPQ